MAAKRFGVFVTWGGVVDFDDWYALQYHRVLVACVAVGRDLDVAQDATDEAFARACERWASVSEMASPGGWVQTVALNHVRRVERRRRLERIVLRRRVPETPVEVPDREVWDAVRGLPRRQRTAVALRYLQDLSEPQVAEVMGISRGAASSSLAAARSRLRVVLGETDEERVHD